MSEHLESMLHSNDFLLVAAKDDEYQIREGHTVFFTAVYPEHAQVCWSDEHVKVITSQKNNGLVTVSGYKRVTVEGPQELFTIQGIDVVTETAITWAVLKEKLFGGTFGGVFGRRSTDVANMGLFLNEFVKNYGTMVIEYLPTQRRYMASVRVQRRGYLVRTYGYGESVDEALRQLTVSLMRRD